ncbi:MAG TPA: HesA/MoeB/ThiF family protein [Niabella sp.]|nr:HesA/MoeB/ThiF family protein [Niabella sp.]HQW14253.1 HesA/MoeB/ThiF family protein [Niabella sp.]HQX19653.1 HesA/MoeB/ThiF family protein [Niabella sp.]HQX39913.1 HesA/MoeB/ThiF family protein [Niabella sp.]HRB06906.1 HesA/MoeB/ThiF family protein [Niabella sp.]
MKRYLRQTILPQFGIEAQKKLLAAKVLVVGAGGLGCPVLQYLTAAGVGTIGMADGDTIDLSNLHRQVLFSQEDIGYNKTIVAHKKLLLLNSDVQFNLYPFDLDPSNLFEVLPAYDVVVDCTDNFSIRYLLNDGCALLNKPLVFASIFQYEAQVSVFHFGHLPFNLRDLFAEIPNKKAIPNCAEAGVLGVLAGIAGTFQANEVIKIITGCGTPCTGKLLLYNSQENSIEQISLTKAKNIFIPKNKEDILRKEYQFSCKNINSIYHLDELIKVMTFDNAALIDVRNLTETPAIIKFQSIQIPLPLLEQSLDRIKAFNHIACICQSGIRSAKAIELLQNHYPDKHFYNVHGGIEIFK